MEIYGADGAMVGSGMVFGEIVGKILTALQPIFTELALFDVIADPIETHIKCF
jgi:hypothetical protein